MVPLVLDLQRMLLRYKDVLGYVGAGAELLRLVGAQVPSPGATHTAAGASGGRVSRGSTGLAQIPMTALEPLFLELAPGLRRHSAPPDSLQLPAP